MSIDYFSYISDSNVLAKDFEEYCQDIGFKVEAHPEFNFREDSGFLPFKLCGDFIDSKLSDSYFLTGFEIYVDDFAAYKPLQPKPENFFKKLFRKKAIVETKKPSGNVVKDKTLSVYFRCSSQDSFEILMAHLFGAFLCRNKGGVFEDPQTGEFYNDYRLMEKEIRAIVAELKEEYTKNNLRIHEFIE